jgi:membrane protease YdiL (CAAX protease family)
LWRHCHDCGGVFMLDKVVRFPLVLILLGFGSVMLPVMAVGRWVPGFEQRVVLNCVVALVGYLAFKRWIERRDVPELALRGAFGEWVAGLALGGGVFCLTIGSIWIAGGVGFDGANTAPDLRYALGIAVMSGVVEEVSTRGVVFRLLEGWLGSWIALALSALMFGALHLMNPNATWAAAAAIALEAGVMLGAAFMVTRRLYLAIGLHMGWNFTQAGVFGVAVSGAEVGGWLQSYPTGPDWLSGGAFGVEASVLAVVWCTALGIGLLAMAARRGNLLSGHKTEDRP